MSQETPGPRQGGAVSVCRKHLYPYISQSLATCSHLVRNGAYNFLGEAAPITEGNSWAFYSQSSQQVGDVCPGPIPGIYTGCQNSIYTSQWSCSFPQQKIFCSCHYPSLSAHHLLLEILTSLCVRLPDEDRLKLELRKAEVMCFWVTTSLSKSQLLTQEMKKMMLELPFFTHI